MEINVDRQLVDAVTRSCIDSYLKEDNSQFKLTVSGDCMSPVLKDSEQISIQGKDKYFPGDIVAFYSSVYSSHVVHRVLGVIPFQQKARYLIKADNARRPDMIVEERDILGSVINVPVSLRSRLSCLAQSLYWMAMIIARKIVNGSR